MNVQYTHDMDMSVCRVTNGHDILENGPQSEMKALSLMYGQIMERDGEEMEGEPRASRWKAVGGDDLTCSFEFN